MEIIKAPFPYVGNKYRHMELILNHLPDNIKTFVEPFGGSAVVGLNAILNRSSIQNYAYNDACEPISNIIHHTALQHNDTNFMKLVWAVNEAFPDNKEGFLALREAHNENITNVCERAAAELVCIIARSFSNDIRFNKKGNVNIPYGERNYLRLHEIIEANKILSRSVHTITDRMDFRDHMNSHSIVSIEPFFFIDPPYLNSTFIQGNGWKEEDDDDLYTLLRRFNVSGFKWMLTNTLYNRGKHNPILQKFIDDNDWNIVDMKGNYGNSSFRKSKAPTVELMIMNY